MEEMRNAYGGLARKPQGKNLIRGLRHRQEDMDVTETRCECID
jgi:hypothetical protein